MRLFINSLWKSSKREVVLDKACNAVITLDNLTSMCFCYVKWTICYQSINVIRIGGHEHNFVVLPYIVHYTRLWLG